MTRGLLQRTPEDRRIEDALNAIAAALYGDYTLYRGLCEWSALAAAGEW